MKAWFCYELNFANQPVPVVYWDELPKATGGKETQRQQLQIVALSKEEMSMFLRELSLKYPYTKPEVK
jgi:hypothetical protein